jgi:hypothetical protein
VTVKYSTCPAASFPTPRTVGCSTRPADLPATRQAKANWVGIMARNTATRKRPKRGQGRTPPIGIQWQCERPCFSNLPSRQTRSLIRTCTVKSKSCQVVPLNGQHAWSVPTHRIAFRTMANRNQGEGVSYLNEHLFSTASGEILLLSISLSRAPLTRHNSMTLEKNSLDLNGPDVLRLRSLPPLG